jgi:predicted DsbA family dithiol-disulfide isomerase
MLDILFITDYVCPYCLVAKEALKKALIATKTEAMITYHPMELTMEPEPRVDTWSDEVRRSKYQVLVEPCRQLGIDMKLPPHVVPRPYTRLAYEGLHYASDHGKSEEYNDLLYNAYFIDEKDIGDLDVLVSLAESIGLDGADYRAALEKGTYKEKQEKLSRYAREVLRPKGIPAIYIDGQKVNLSDYSVEEMMGIILYKTQNESAAGMVCGVDGCF